MCIRDSKIPIERLKPDAVFQVGGTPDWLAIDEHVWVSNKPTDSVSRFDPKTNPVVAEIYVADGSYGLTFGENAVWVTSTDHDLVTRVDPNTNLIVEAIKVGPKPRFIAAGAGAVW